jgi:homoserine dehydrogenase
VREILENPEIDVVAECIGGIEPALGYIRRALRNGKHVVTPNKEVIAKHGHELVALARDNGVNLYFDASVCGGIPILRGLKNSLAANNIQKVFGIMNGTTNFILSKMTDEGADFGRVLAEAQDLGFAEQDPTADVDGTTPPTS